MRTSTEEQNYSTEHHPMTYTHRNGEVTHYDLQEVRQEGQPPRYIISESENNTGPGFDDANTRYVVAHEAAQTARTLNDPEVFPEADKKLRPEEVQLYQQRPDGDFDRVSFKSQGYSGSNVDLEFAQNDPKEYAARQAERANNPEPEPGFYETSRTQYTREEVQERIGDAPMHAPEETIQQAQGREQESLNQQWKDLSGPAINRDAEVAAHQAQQAQQAAQDQQRAQEQSQEMNQHTQQHQHSQEF